MSETLDSRMVSDLKVTELRSELEKRDLDKTGVKAVLLERLQKALLEEGEDPENYVFNKIDLMSEKTLKSPSIEKRPIPVTDKKEVRTVQTPDKKPTTPNKTLKTNIVGKRPGPKSKTCGLPLKNEKPTLAATKKSTDEVKQEPSNTIVTEETKQNISFNSNSSDVTNSANETEAKEIDMDNVQLNNSEDVDVMPHDSETVLNHNASVQEKTDNLEKSKLIAVPMERKCTEKEKELVQTKNLVNAEEIEVDQNCTKNTKATDDSVIQEKENSIVDKKIEVIEAKKINIIPKNIDEDNIQDEELDHEVDEEEIGNTNEFNDTNDLEKAVQENSKDDNNEDSINLTIGEDDIKLFADEEDTNIEKEDEVIENRTKEEMSLSKQRESRHPVTASNGRATTASVKSRRSATEKRSSVGDKPRSSHKEDKDNSNAKPIISVSTPKDEKKEEEKQLIKDKVEAGNKQSNDSKNPQTSNDTSKKSNASLVRNIWVSGLSSITKATDLKQLFSKYGKVVGAKVVTNAKTPGARCYGFVTLSSAEDANRSIEHLHKTELHGRVISVERAKRDNGYQQTAKTSDAIKTKESSESERKIKKPEEKKDKREEKREKRPEITINDVQKKHDVSRDIKRSVSKDQAQETKRSKIVIEVDDRKKDRSIKSKSNERDRERLRELERERERLEKEKRRQQEILNFTKMKTERERQKQKEQERAIREEERKRRIEKERQLEIERKQKEESIRLEKERQKLRIERERIEKEKAELLRIERENQRIERERLQREKEELRRAQEKLEETKRQAVLKRAIPPSPPPPSKRHSSGSSRYDERKEPPIRSSRVQPSTDYINQTAPPPPNITSSRHRYDQHSSDSRRSRPSPPPPPPPASRPKDSTVSMRYGAPPPTDHHYRSRDDRTDRREESRRKESSSGGSSSRHAHTSTYDSNKSSYGLSRNSQSTNWTSAPVKSSYGSLGSSSGSSSMVMSNRLDPWSNTSGSREIETNVWQRPLPPAPTDKWNSTSSNPTSLSLSGRSSSSNPLYGNNHQVLPNVGLNMSSNFSDNRFDSYKMSGMSRKY
ncbi:SAP domain,RNA recognition motif domain [Cinara cedri]|uniref:SAP domain,RNA recognition motif domain n=1 Tax=Cinara cedri TaxID=506608 RepID=A0A5E4MMP3_9HEMI|nr:SAP domain,RNA recognition motif domain [Cinara cedri]